jgi:hypothetical protein
MADKHLEGGKELARPQVSDALWARTWPEIAATLPETDPGTARFLLNSLLFQALTGISCLDALDAENQQLQAIHSSWRERGLLERLARLLLVQID